MVNNVAQNQRAPASLRRTHRSLALNEILMTGGISRTGLADELGMSQMAMSRIVRDLFDADLVEEYGVEVRENGPGRRQRMLRIRPDGAYSTGIVLSAYSNEICIVKANGEILASRIIPVKKIADSEAAVRKLAKALNKLIDENNIPRQRIVGVGVAVAAQLDPTNQSVVAGYLLGWESFDLVEQVANITGLPAYAETIANALTLAEVTVGTIKKKENVIVVRSATTIAASVLIHGQLVRGQAQQAGRIGHFRTKKTNLRCSCGSNSCLNCCASGWSVLARLGKTSNNEYHPDDVAAYAREINQLIENQASAKAGQKKDASQTRILKDAGAAFGRSLEQLNQFLEPQAIIHYGSMSRLVDYRDGISQSLCSNDEGKATLAKIRYGEISAIRAAGILALKESIYSPTLDFEQLCETATVASPEAAVGNNQ